ESIHHAQDPVAAVKNANIIAIGGGNTFQLLAELHKQKLIEPIQEKVKSGMPLMGWSAGSNVCCPTLKTTNDMPIVEPASFNALNFVPFQINAHYTETTLANHGGESRRQRLTEFLIANKETRIAALPEGAYLQCENDEITFKGPMLKVLQQGTEDRCYEGEARFHWNLDELTKSGEKTQ
ncbi:MAG: dipeptidase PepE, partial [Planctomycetota bacterium]|nr:dipeptidase PepE [Planctomycetota bacterium]